MSARECSARARSPACRRFRPRHQRQYPDARRNPRSRSTLANLNRTRSVIYTAALTLIKNAVQRLDAEWVDDLGMEKAFGEDRTRVG